MISRRLRVSAGALAATLLTAVPAQATWLRAETPNFILYSRSDGAEIRAQAQLLEDFHHFLRALTGIEAPPSPQPLEVYLVASGAELRAVRDMAPGISGVYVAGSGGAAALVDESSDGDGDSVMLHEVAHHFLKQYRPQPYPTWFSEGFAEYVSTVWLGETAVELGRVHHARAAALAERDWLPLDRILFGEVPEDPAAMEAYYGQSWLLAHYLLRSDELRPRLFAFLSACASGADPRSAFALHLPPIPLLEIALRSYAREGIGYGTYFRERRPPADVRIAALPDSADHLLLYRAAMDLGPPPGSEATLLAGVRAAAKGREDVFALRVLAQAEAYYGSSRKADRLLDRLLEAEPGDAELLYWKGMRHLVAARAAGKRGRDEYREARTWFVRAHRADPTHYPTLLRYAEALHLEDDFVSDETIGLLLLARRLAPHSQEATMSAASLLLARGRYQEAERLLLPLAAGSDDLRRTQMAEQMLRRARRGGDLPLAPHLGFDGTDEGALIP
jgi:tetratricopeptide (TPR) repeat protein